jgi:GMP synthase-like glutamine amidotransferase
MGSMTAWRNTVRNAANPPMGKEMVSKVIRRLEPDTQTEAMQWASERAEPIPDHFEQWVESEGLRCRVFEFRSKFVGAVGLPRTMSISG